MLCCPAISRQGKERLELRWQRLRSRMAPALTPSQQSPPARALPLRYSSQQLKHKLHWAASLSFGEILTHMQLSLFAVQGTIHGEGKSLDASGKILVVGGDDGRAVAHCTTTRCLAPDKKVPPAFSLISLCR
eukprot:2975738-Rhodomonas_salina.4